MDMETCYGGGDIAATFFGTLICGILVAYIAWWLYRKYWNTRKGTHLVQEDPETGKAGEFAFDNPAFKTDGTKVQSSPLDTKWSGNKPTNGTSVVNEKRKTQDDNAVSANGPPRIIGLRGSDFTGLGIELCGGIKEGIFVRKVMPQGPATGLVNVGDKITSITIDFNHLVLEDAVSILSYASPYNVKLELVDAKANVAAMVTSNSPKSNTSTLSHPLYRSGSQSDVNTIERNSRKNLFPDDKDFSAQQKTLPVAHKENEVKSKTSSLTKQFKEMIEEKFQNKSNHHEAKIKDEVDHAKSTVAPTEENKKGLKFGIRVLPDLFGKSPNKVQADNENNVNLEKTSNGQQSKDTIFQRQGSINSSGIKRDAAGIPQEMPEHMMQAALSAKDNRKSNNHDKNKGKGKAPKPPPVEIDMNMSTETMNTTLDINSPRPVEITTIQDQLNFTDNFHEVSHVERPSNSSTPKAQRRNDATVSPINSPNNNGSGSHIVELSAQDITVHQSSEEEDNEDSRKASSLGDLSRLDGNAGKSNAANRPPTVGTLERAQSLEMAENTQIPTAPPKKRKAPVSDSDLCEKEPRLMMVTDMDGMDTLQRGRLRSANEWGNLEDAISGKNAIRDNDNSDTDSYGRMDDAMEQELDSSVTSLVREVMAVVDGGKKDLEDEMGNVEIEVKETVERPFKTMEQLLKEKLDEARAVLETDDDEETGEEKTGAAFTTSTKLNGSLDRREATKDSPVHIFKDEPAKINFTFKMDQQDMPNLASETPPESPGVNAVEQVKVISYGTNASDDIKVTRFPFGSLERPKSDVLKKVIAQKMVVPLEDYTTTTTTTTLISEPQPVSLTLIRGDQLDETPIYASDVKGVNSISISSMEVNIEPHPAATVSAPVNGMANTVVTISTNPDRSQPSSIILIEDEKLDFTLRTPPSELNDDVHVTLPPVPPLPAARALPPSDEVFIVDSLSQPKRKSVDNESTEGLNSDHMEQLDDTPVEELSDQDVLDALKTFVTEIDVQNEAEKVANKMALDATKKFLEHEKRTTTDFQLQNHQAPPMVIPRNTEIKFTTSTYESSSPRINGNGERRHSAHVDQIRSNFERNLNSEIPVPVRKSSIPTLKLSPSKIPVFNSSGGANTTRSPSVEGLQTSSSSSSSPPQQRFSLTSKSPSPTNNNRVLVSVTSIKNSARHPSGK